MSIHEVTIDVGGRSLVIETGRMARLAAGSVVVRFGDTMVMSAASASPPRPGIDFFPLTIDYREKTYAAGKIPGGFLKRESAPSPKEILTMRMTDRPIRPLWPKGFKMDLQAQTFVISYDQLNDPDVLSINGAGAAVALSSLPFLGPIGAVRVGLVDGEYIAFPDNVQRAQSEMDLVVAGTANAVTMVEAGMNELSEEVALGAIAFAHEVIKKICAGVEELRKMTGWKADAFESPEEDDSAFEAVKAQFGDQFKAAVHEKVKLDRNKAKRAVIDAIREALVETDDETEGRFDFKAVNGAINKLEKEIIRAAAFSGTRIDGRATDKVRDIDIEVGLLPRAHGSALFTRGETQALVTTTLGTGHDEKMEDGLHAQAYTRKYYLHYNFPPLCVGETRPIRGPSRREVGHGALAERSLLPVLPDMADFPYTLRVVSDILMSNGSSSMASVCGTTLSMMDAGVQIRRPVAGIAMGLVTEGDDYAILSDILGDGDHAAHFARELLARGHTVRTWGAPAGAIPRSGDDEGGDEGPVSFRPDAVFAYAALSPAAWRGARLSRRLGIPFLPIETGAAATFGPLDRVLMWTGQRLFGRTVKRATATAVAVDPVVRDELVDEGFAPERVRVVPRGVDLALFRPGLSSAIVARHRIPGRVLLYAGPFDRERGVHLLVEALRAHGRAARRLVARARRRGPRAARVARQGRTPRRRFAHVLPTAAAGGGVAGPLGPLDSLRGARPRRQHARCAPGPGPGLRAGRAGLRPPAPGRVGRARGLRPGRARRGPGGLDGGPAAGRQLARGPQALGHPGPGRGRGASVVGGRRRLARGAGAGPSLGGSGAGGLLQRDGSGRAGAHGLRAASRPAYLPVALRSSSLRKARSAAYCRTAPSVLSSIFEKAAPTLTLSARSSISLTVAKASQKPGLNSGRRNLSLSSVPIASSCPMAKGCRSPAVQVKRRPFSSRLAMRPTPRQLLPNWWPWTGFLPGETRWVSVRKCSMRFLSVGENKTAASSSMTGPSSDSSADVAAPPELSAAAASSSELKIGTTRSRPTFSITSRQKDDGRAMTSLPPSRSRAFEALMIAPRAVELMNLTKRRFKTARETPACSRASISSCRLRT